MNGQDLDYVIALHRAGLIGQRCLEIGTQYGQTCKETLEGFGLEYYGADTRPSEHVDFVLDLEDANTFSVLDDQKFDTLLILNVLEHTFDPIRCLDNALTLLRPGGLCVTIVPAVWPLHSYPFDCWRINPDFYREYAKRRGLTLIKEHFKYIQRGVVPEGEHSLPHPNKWLYSRIIHKLFNTSGRGMAFSSYIAIGAAFLV
jgi:2-polyprenyl-3-methyl-5-hydroxy-6-metoxy-1,4-benzoquinol methylase